MEKALPNCMYLHPNDITKQLIGRKGSFDSMHRVMNQKFKCHNIHGHTWLYELIFGFTTSNELGYAIDFSEIKRIAGQFIDDFFDHGAILNPMDKELILAAEKTKSKKWLMSLNGENQYCNPSVENMAKELFLAMEILFKNNPELFIYEIKLYETPNCYTQCFEGSISYGEREEFYKVNEDGISHYRDELGIIEYDDRVN